MRGPGVSRGQNDTNVQYYRVLHMAAQGGGRAPPARHPLAQGGEPQEVVRERHRGQ